MTKIPLKDYQSAKYFNASVLDRIIVAYYFSKMRGYP